MKKVKVLVADDNADLLASLEIQLQVFGYEVVTCTNADLAVAYAQKHAPDIMVVDICMDAGNRMILSSTGNGLGVLDRISKLPELRGIPVIYITGSSAPQIDLRAKQLGAYGLVHKPVDFSGLLEMIQAAVKGKPCGCETPGGLGRACEDKGSASVDFPRISKAS